MCEFCCAGSHDLLTLVTVSVKDQVCLLTRGAAHKQKLFSLPAKKTISTLDSKMHV